MHHSFPKGWSSIGFQTLAHASSGKVRSRPMTKRVPMARAVDSEARDRRIPVPLEAGSVDGCMICVMSISTLPRSDVITVEGHRLSGDSAKRYMSLGCCRLDGRRTHVGDTIAWRRGRTSDSKIRSRCGRAKSPPSWFSRCFRRFSSNRCCTSALTNAYPLTHDSDDDECTGLKSKRQDCPEEWSSVGMKNIKVAGISVIGKIRSALRMSETHQKNAQTPSRGKVTSRNSRGARKMRCIVRAGREGGACGAYPPKSR